MNVNRKKLMFITARLPYPAISGRKNVMFHYCKILHDVYHYEIIIISFLEEGDKVEPKPGFIQEVIILPKVTGKRKIINLIKDTFFLRKFPMQVSLYYDPNSQKKVNQMIANTSPDIVMTDMVRMTEYARNYQGYKIADLDDMLSIRYERQLNMDLNVVNPYGAYLYSLPPIIQCLLSLKWIKKFMLKNEILLLKQYEKDISKAYDRIIFVAQSEANRLNRELNVNKAIGVPLGVDLDYFGEFYGKIQPRKNTIAFLGSMSVAHNEAGVIYFVREILPLIEKEIPDATFVIVGGGITSKVKKIATEKVKITGKVDDVRRVVGACSVFVCPLTFGSGIKTKNLEAMAMGVPVVTTSVGAENIDAVDGMDWLIADEEQEFANNVIQVLQNKKLHNELMKNGHQFVEEKFTWKNTEKCFREAIG